MPHAPLKAGIVMDPSPGVQVIPIELSETYAVAVEISLLLPFPVKDTQIGLTVAAWDESNNIATTVLLAATPENIKILSVSSCE